MNYISESMLLRVRDEDYCCNDERKGIHEFPLVISILMGNRFLKFTDRQCHWCNLWHPLQPRFRWCRLPMVHKKASSVGKIILPLKMIHLGVVEGIAQCRLLTGWMGLWIWPLALTEGEKRKQFWLCFPPVYLNKNVHRVDQKLKVPPLSKLLWAQEKSLCFGENLRDRSYKVRKKQLASFTPRSYGWGQGQQRSGSGEWGNIGCGVVARSVGISDEDGGIWCGMIPQRAGWGQGTERRKWHLVDCGKGAPFRNKTHVPIQCSGSHLNSAPSVLVKADFLSCWNKN